jgi:hypothetical protein
MSKHWMPGSSRLKSAWVHPDRFGAGRSRSFALDPRTTTSPGRWLRRLGLAISRGPPAPFSLLSRLSWGTCFEWRSDHAPSTSASGPRQQDKRYRKCWSWRYLCRSKSFSIPRTEEAEPAQ